MGVKMCFYQPTSRRISETVKEGKGCYWSLIGSRINTSCDTKNIDFRWPCYANWAFSGVRHKNL